MYPERFETVCKCSLAISGELLATIKTITMKKPGKKPLE
jgi:hypothetical protein